MKAKGTASAHAREGEIQNRVRLELGNPTRYPEFTHWRNACGFDAAARQRYGVGNPGGADLIGLWRTQAGVGRFVGIELKSAGGRQSPEQRAFEQLVISKGGIYVVLRSVEEAQQWAASMRSEQ